MANIDFFAEELDMIEDTELRGVTELALENAPEYFWTVPASITGKHHSTEDREEQGTIRHSAKVGWVAWKLFEVFGIKPELGMSAGLLHDIFKYGRKAKPNMDAYGIHGTAAAAWLTKLEFVSANWHEKHMTEAFKADWELICRCVKTHMGRFGDQAKEFMLSSDLPQKLFHCADVMAASKGFASLKYGMPEQAIPLTEILSAKMFFERTDDGLVIAFGKHKGLSVEYVVDTLHGPGYLVWILQQVWIPAYQKDWLNNEMSRLEALRAERLAQTQGELFA